MPKPEICQYSTGQSSRNSKPVLKLDLHMAELERYPSLAAAARSERTTPARIREAIHAGKVCKGLYWRFAAILLAVASSAAAQSVSPIVRVYNMHPGGANDIGSGTVVDVVDGESLVMTCHHVFGDGVGMIVVQTQNGDRYRATMKAYDKGNNDLVALSCREIPGIKPTGLGEFVPGQTVHVYGYGGDGTLRRFVGKTRVSGRTEGATHNSYHMTSEVRSGDSGGGVLDPESGKFLGVVWGSIPRGTRDSGGSLVQPGAELSVGNSVRDFLVRMSQCSDGRCWKGSPGFFGGNQRMVGPPQRDPRPLVPLQPKPGTQGCNCKDQFADIWDRFDEMDGSFEKIDKQLGDVSVRIDGVVTRIDKIEDAFSKLDLDGMLVKLDNISVIIGKMADQQEVQDSRLDALEAKECDGLTEEQIIAIIIKTLEDRLPPDTGGDQERILYFTSTKGCPNCAETDQRISELKDSGYPITIIDLDPTQTTVRGVPRLYNTETGRTIEGISNINVYLGLLMPN